MSAQLHLDVSLDLDPEDPEACEAVIDDLLARFGEWMVAGEHPGVEWAVSETLRFKAGYLDGRLGSWRAADLDEILIELFPRKVSADEAGVAMVCPTLRAFFSWLDTTGQLAGDGDPLPALLAALDRIEPGLAAAMADDAKFGMGKSFTQAMLADGVDLDDAEAVQAWVGAYNAGLGAERFARAVLPSAEVPDDETLAGLAAGFLEAAGESAESLADPLDTWRRMLVALLGIGVVSAGTGPPASWARVLDGFALVLLAELFAGGAVPMDEVTAEATAFVEDALAKLGEPELEATTTALPAAVRLLVDRLAGVGALTVADRQVDVAPLGRWLLHEVVRARDFDLPDVSDVAGMGAAALLATARDWNDDAIAAALEAWVAARDPVTAAEELASVAADTDDGHVRALAFAALDVVGPAAEPAVRALRGHAGCRVPATGWLVDNGYEQPPPLDPDASTEVLVDTLEVLLATGGPVRMAERFSATIAVDDRQRQLDRLWRHNGPAVPQILDALAAHAPKPVAKAAAKARFKRRTVTSR